MWDIEISKLSFSDNFLTRVVLPAPDGEDKMIASERMKQFERDVLHLINYDYVIINDKIDSCYSKIKSLIKAEINNGSKDYDVDYIRAHIENLTS